MSSLSRLSVTVLAVLCAHCDSPRIVAAPSAIVVSPPAVQLGDVLVGDTATMTVEVSNHGAPVQLSLRADEPVTLDTAALALRRGERKTVLAALTATTAGPISKMVHVFTGGVVAGQVRIEAVAVQRPGCVANECETASVASDGTCRRDVAPDGVACASACLAEATCASAICVGTPRNCDDGDACTVDSCGAEGCQHTARSCRAERACHTAVCDPSEGCREVPVADGTACGESDCTTSTVCMNGACTTVPTPQGGSCQPSPCAIGGQCDASGACIGGASAYLKADWTYAPQGDVGAFGAASRTGTVYFVESTPRFDGFQASRTLELVALKSTGNVAWRQTLIAADAGVDVSISPMARGHLAVAGDVVVSMLQDGKALYAFDEHSGATLWTRSVPLLMDEAFNYPAHPGARVVDAAEVSGALVLSVSAPQSGPQQCEGMWSGGLVAVAQRTGSVLWAHSQQEGCWNGASVVADAAGRTFMTVKRALEPETTWAFDAAGALLWKMPGRALMASHGRVIAGAIRDGQSGAALSPLPSPSPVAMGQQWLWYSGRAFDYRSQSWAAPTDQGHEVGFVNGAEFVVRRGWTVAYDGTGTESGTEIVGLRPDGGNWVCRIDPEWPMRFMAVDRTVLVGQRLIALGRRYNPFGSDTPPKSYVVFSIPLTGYEVRPGDWPATDGDGLRRAPR